MATQGQAQATALSTAAPRCSLGGAAASTQHQAACWSLSISCGSLIVLRAMQACWRLGIWCLFLYVATAQEYLAVCTLAAGVHIGLIKWIARSTALQFLSLRLQPPRSMCAVVQIYMPVASIGAVKPTKPSACQGHAVPFSVTLGVWWPSLAYICSLGEWWALSGCAKSVIDSAGRGDTLKEDALNVMVHAVTDAAPL